MFFSNIGIPFKVNVGSKYQELFHSGKIIIYYNLHNIK